MAESASQHDNSPLLPTIKLYVRYLRLERNLSPNTIEAYRNDLAHLEAFMMRNNLKLENVTLEQLHTFAASLHEYGITPRSQARVLSGVRSFFRFLVLDGVVESDPTELLEWPSLPEHLPVVLTLEEIDRIEDSIDLSKAEGARNRAIIEVLFSCGLRVSDKGNKERLVPVSNKAIADLKRWFFDRNLMKIKPGEDDYVFLNRRGAHLTRTMILIMVKRQAEEAGIKKTISPHTFRHSFATALLQGGADLRSIQAMLGHEKIDTTLVYTHISNEQLRKAILEHHPRNI